MSASPETKSASVEAPVAQQPQAALAGTSDSAALAPEIPAGVQTFAAFRKLTAADLDASFGDYTVHAKADAPAQVVETCRALLALPLTPELELESFNESEERSFWFSIMNCAAWSMVQNAQPARRTRIEPLFAAKDPTRLLPPLLGLTDFMEIRSKVESAATSCRSWRDFDRSVRVSSLSEDGFQVEARGWRGEVHYLARADFDGDGMEDVLVRRDAEAEGGSFRAAALFLLSETDQDRCIRVTSVLGQS